MSSMLDPTGDTRLNYLSFHMQETLHKKYRRARDHFRSPKLDTWPLVNPVVSLLSAVLPVFNFSVSYHNNCGFVSALRAMHV